MTGKQYSLKDLFNPNSNYVEKLSQIISMKIEAWEVPLLEDFTTIRPDQDYYLADHTIVIYFQLYEITPYVYGFPYFPIPIKSIEDIIRTDGPLNTLLTF
nr:RsiV family protein [Psychrobacillus sp. BL-248-WT-3]